MQAPASSLTRYLACGGQMVDTRVLRRLLYTAKIPLAKKIEILPSQSIMHVSTFLQALPDPWMGWARHEVAPMGCGAALSHIGEPIPGNSSVAMEEIHHPWNASWFLVEAITNSRQEGKAKIPCGLVALTCSLLQGLKASVSCLFWHRKMEGWVAPTLSSWLASGGAQNWTC